MKLLSLQNSEEKFQLLMTTLKEACDIYAIEINTKKNRTEVMVVAKDPERSSIQVNDIMFNQTDFQVIWDPNNRRRKVH